jgi:molecular chaperone GrpE (heat shock protein)
MKNLTIKPPLRAVHMTLFPCMDTLEDAIEHCCAQMPVKDSQRMIALLMLYHNTLLNTLEK